MTAAYGSRSIAPTRARRTPQQMDELRLAIYEVLEQQHPATCRGLFYALVSRGFVGKTEREYKSTVVRLAGEMRLAELIPFDWLTDATRWMRKPPTWSSPEAALAAVAQQYRRDLWRDADAYVEVWCEKDALAGALYQVTEFWDVPLMVTRGYPSLTFLHSASLTIRAMRRPAFLYYLGDRDPSGRDIPRSLEARLREFAPEVDLTFEVVAVTDDQVTEFDLQTRPTKQTDSRARNFDGESVELDAIPAPDLRAIVEGCIARHVNEDRLAILEAVEREERDLLVRLADRRVLSRVRLMTP